MESQAFESAHIVHRGAAWFVGVGGTGPYFHDRTHNWVIPLWRSVLDRRTDLGGEAGGALLSPVHAREGEFTFYGGVTLAAMPARVPAGMAAFELPARDYAVTRVVGDDSAVAAAYRQLPAWAAARGRRVDRGVLSLEVYPHGPALEAGATHDYEVWLPLEPDTAVRTTRVATHVGAVVVPVDDVHRARAWYRDTLGFAVGDVEFGHLCTVRPDEGPHLLLDAQLVPGGVGRAVPKGDYPLFMLVTNDLHGTYGDLRARGVEMAEYGGQAIQAGHWFNLRDSEGNLVMMCARR